MSRCSLAHDRDNPFIGALAKIPEGETRTFMELAHLAGRPGAARAAGRAINSCSSRSKLPWHRVVYSDGSFARDPLRSNWQLRRLRREGARPEEGESLLVWARRRGSRWLADYRTQRYFRRDQAEVARLHPNRVEAFRSEDIARARGFRLKGEPLPSLPVPLPQIEGERSQSGRSTDLNLSKWLNWAARDVFHLQTAGFCHLKSILSEVDCEAILADCTEASRFDRRVDMMSRGFGVGSYYYFAEPIPTPLNQLRAELYSRLRGAAASLPGYGEEDFGAELVDFWKRCRALGQSRSSSILLCYPEGGVNHLHRDIYGKVAFPFQALVMLSQVGRD